MPVELTIVACRPGPAADTNLTPHQYQWLGSAYYFGYLGFSLPNAYFLQKFPLKRYLGACILVWGVMLVLMSVFRTFAGLCFCRVALGMSEGVITVSPGGRVTRGIERGMTDSIGLWSTLRWVARVRTPHQSVL